MKTILIIIALSTSPNGGVAIHSVPLKSMEACKAAADALAKKGWARITTLCVQE